MTNERPKNDSFENLFPDKPNEVIEVIKKLGIGFDELNDKLVNLLEENQSLKQQNKEILRINSDLNEKHQEILHINSDLNEKLQESLRINSDLNEKLQESLHINSVLNEKHQESLRNLNEKLQEKDKKFENLQQHVLILENHKNEEKQQLEIFYQNLNKNLEILKLNEINENDIKSLKENKNMFSKINENNKQEHYNINESTTVDKGLGEDTEKSSHHSDIKVVVGLDFGTGYSGFSYCHVANSQSIISNDSWPGESGQFKTKTVLQYDVKYNNVEFWGTHLAKRLIRRNKIHRNKPVELFKLCLGNLLLDDQKPKLPVDYKKAITDYFREIGKVIKNTVEKHWPGVDFFENVLMILPILVEYSERDEDIIRECIYNADLISDECSENLQFITESEAATIYCIENGLNEIGLLNIGTTFMIVDCGYTTSLTTRKFLGNKQSGEITDHFADLCGSESIDRKFIDVLREKLGDHAINLLIENHNNEFQCLVRDFCRLVKIPFTGDDTNYLYELDIEENAPILLHYVNKETRKIIEENDCLISIKYNDIKKMFDPVIDRIINMIRVQLSNNYETCSAMFLVGGLSQNIYFQKRIKQEFQDRVQTISVPSFPIAAIARGAVIYGSLINLDRLSFNRLNKLKFRVTSRILKFTYGIELIKDWKEGVDPPYRKTHDGKVYKFSPLVRRGEEIRDQTFSFERKPEKAFQISMKCAFYYTREYSAEYLDEPGMELLGVIEIELPDVHFGINRSIEFGLTFGQLEIIAFSRNKTNGQQYQTTFSYPDDF
ncbi:hypothetical protein C1645_828289 [Glomus cerebriforme]|uniref:Hsp70 family protein n=1 Tax=Glomus cerebriforme TaxID=658196 RepID=A0A397SW09_9GLOM|nr:hypothetical protein C1645_828289 [Glomus cerebriforme]